MRKMLNTSIRRAIMWQTGDFCGLESAMQGRPIRLSFCLCCECFFRVVAAVAVACAVAVANVLLTSFLRQTQTCFHFFQRILRMQLCRRRRPCRQPTTGREQLPTTWHPHGSAWGALTVKFVAKLVAALRREFRPELSLSLERVCAIRCRLMNYCKFGGFFSGFQNVKLVATTTTTTSTSTMLVPIPMQTFAPDSLTVAATFL